MCIKQIVNDMIKKFNTKDIYELLDILNITLVKKPMKKKKGRFLRDVFGNQTITIDCNLDEHKQKVIIAHELGHAILHEDLDVSYYYDNPLIVKKREEIEADTFAAELLLDDDIEIEYMNYTVEQLASVYNVPAHLIELKYNNNVYY